MRKLFCYLLFAGLFWQACTNKDYSARIAALEQSAAQSGTSGSTDSLVLLYREAVKAVPEDHARNFAYLVKGAKIKFTRQNDAVEAVRWIDEAVKNHGQGQSMMEPIGVLTLIWQSYIYKASPELQRNPDEIDLMHAYLDKNITWIDSNLVRLDREMGSPVVNDNAKADEFIRMAEAYASLVQTTRPDKSVDLTLKAAGLAKTIGNPNKALQLYYNVGEKMPQHPKAPTALFMMAFIYENDLRQLDKAKATYEEFLKRYPNDPDYADDAHNTLKYLGLSAEEILKRIEKNPQ
ncbi:MAG: tetratricopeptide repeat protein [Saprospiraceae bacterium]|nr:tetratricopeptide repeat protein [Saprospiraceae bacterium]